MKFEHTHIDLGTIREKTKQVVTFKSTEELPENLQLGASCGCSKPIKTDSHTIKVNFSPGVIPAHLRQTGFYTTKKTIIVKDPITGEEDHLTFSAKVSV